MGFKIEKRIEQFEQMGFGMFIHWGLYSILGQGEWIKHVKRIPDSEYDKLISDFRCKDFDADKIVAIAKATGMKYITLTTRHHDGFSLYDTMELNKYSSIYAPCKRDLVREFVDACNRGGIKPFFYHTTLDWHNKDFTNDFPKYLEYLRRSVEILCTQYGEIGGLWFDGNWSKPSDTDWKLDELYGTIRKYQPEAMIINNTGISARGRKGHPEIDSVTFEQDLPKPIERVPGEKYISGEMCYTLNDHWGDGFNDLNYKSPPELIKTLCRCRKVGANLLLNVGPDGNGKIPGIMEETLKIIGRWMSIFGDAIYNGRPCGAVGMDEDFVLESEDGKRYLFIFDLPIIGDENVVTNNAKIKPRVFTGMFESISKIKWLDNSLEMKFSHDKKDGVLTVMPTGYSYGNNLIVRVAEVK